MEKVLTGWDHEGLWVDADGLLRILDFCTLFSTCQHIPFSSCELINSFSLALIDRGCSFAPLKVVEAGVSLHIYVGSIGLKTPGKCSGWTEFWTVTQSYHDPGALASLGRQWSFCRRKLLSSVSLSLLLLLS